MIFFTFSLGVRYTSAAPPIIFENRRINVMVVIIIPCSPLPVVPRNWEIITAIRKLITAEDNLTPKVLKIFKNKSIKI